MKYFAFILVLFLSACVDLRLMQRDPVQEPEEEVQFTAQSFPAGEVFQTINNGKVQYKPVQSVVDSAVIQSSNYGIFDIPDSIQGVFSNGTILQTRGFYAPGDGGQAQYRVQADSVLGYITDTIAIIPLSSGNYAVLSAESVDIRMLGAIEDSTSANYNAIHKAISIVSIQGGRVIIPKGNWVLNEQITIQHSVAFVGVDSSILISESGITNNLFWINEDSINVSFNHIWFNNKSSSISSKIAVTGVSGVNLTVSDCHFKDDSIYGMSIYSPSNHTDVVNCTFDNVNNAIRGGGRYNILNNTFTNIGQDAVNFTNSNVNSIISGNKMDNIFNYPIHAAPASGISTNIRIDGNYIRNDTISYCDGGSADQISVFSAEGVVITSNYSIGGGDMGITLENVIGGLIENNVSIYNAKSGIVVGNVGGSSDNITIKGNIFRNNGQHADGTTFSRSPDCSGAAKALAGVYVSNSVDTLIIIGNQMYDDQQVMTQTYAFAHPSVLNKNIVVSNNVYNGTFDFDESYTINNYIANTGGWFKDKVSITQTEGNTGLFIDDGTASASGGISYPMIDVTVGQSAKVSGLKVWEKGNSAQLTVGYYGLSGIKVEIDGGSNNTSPTLNFYRKTGLTTFGGIYFRNVDNSNYWAIGSNNANDDLKFLRNNTTGNGAATLNSNSEFIINGAGVDQGDYKLQVFGNTFVTGRITLGSVDIISGAGDPEGSVTAVVGSLYLRSDGSTSTTLYVKESGTGNTGWAAK